MEELPMENRIGNKKIDVSVIIVVYNQLQTLALTFASLLAQDFNGIYEVIICDDGSDSDLFLGFRDKFDNTDVPIRYVWQQNRYYRAAMARNNGIGLAKGKLLVFLDGDMVPAIDFLSKHVTAHNKAKLLVAGNRRWRTFEQNSLKKNQISISDFLDRIDNQDVDKETKGRELKERKRRFEWLNSKSSWRVCFSCNMSVERSPEVHFDKNFVGWGPDDWELAYRLCVIHGYTPVYRDEIKAYHFETVVSKPFITKSHEEIVRYLRNTCYFYDKTSGLRLEDVFVWFSRLRLNSRSNKWEVIPRPEPTSYNLKELVKKARSWLAANGVYP